MLQFQSDRFQLLRHYCELAVVIVTLQLRQKTVVSGNFIGQRYMIYGCNGSINYSAFASTDLHIVCVSVRDM